MKTWTPEYADSLREWLAYAVVAPRFEQLLTLARDLFDDRVGLAAALDAERAARMAAETERDHWKAEAIGWAENSGHAARGPDGEAAN